MASSKTRLPRHHHGRPDFTVELAFELVKRPAIGGTHHEIRCRALGRYHDLPLFPDRRASLHQRLVLATPFPNCRRVHPRAAISKKRSSKRNSTIPGSRRCRLDQPTNPLKNVATEKHPLHAVTLRTCVSTQIGAGAESVKRSYLLQLRSPQ